MHLKAVHLWQTFVNNSDDKKLLDSLVVSITRQTRVQLPLHTFLVINEIREFIKMTMISIIDFSLWTWHYLECNSEHIIGYRIGYLLVDRW